MRDNYVHRYMLAILRFSPSFLIENGILIQKTQYKMRYIDKTTIYCWAIYLASCYQYAALYMVSCYQYTAFYKKLGEKSNIAIISSIVKAYEMPVK